MAGDPDDECLARISGVALVNHNGLNSLCTLPPLSDVSD
jgi:hypothetical protein